MIRSALLLCAALLTAATVACQLPAPQSSPIRPLDYTSAKCVDGAGNVTYFVNHIWVLPPGYDPQMNGPRYQPPLNIDGVQPFDPNANTAITTDLYTAFNDAPSLVQNHLCALTAIFIDPSDCSNNNAYQCIPESGALAPGEAFTGAWGLRSRNPSDTDYGSTYVSISAALWVQGASAWPVSVYEDSILSFLVQDIRSPKWPSSTPPDQLPHIVYATPASSSDLAVLAALAHELAHVRWALIYARNNTLGNLKTCPGSYIDFFGGWKYNGDIRQILPPNRWRHFASRKNAKGGQTDHQSQPFLYDFLNAANNPNQLLYNLYQASQPWASFFGAYSPDEDFVETYVLYALSGNKLDNANYNGTYLASLPLTIPGYTDPSDSTHYPGQWADVPLDLLAGNKSTLAKKIQCIKDVTAM